MMATCCTSMIIITGCVLNYEDCFAYDELLSLTVTGLWWNIKVFVLVILLYICSL
jgi:hypothetical protein